MDRRSIWKGGESLFRKKKKEKYIPVPGLMGEATDYRVYTMTVKDKAIGFALGFSLGFVIVMVFFRVWLAALIVSVISGFLAQKPYREYRIKTRKSALLLEFRDLLESLTTSFSAGKNTRDAFTDSHHDLLELFGEQSDMVKEMEIIIRGLENNLTIENLLQNFALRSDTDDVESFAGTFEACNRQGGDIKKVVWDTRRILNDKIEIEMEIKTILTEKENELNIMMVMPLVIMLSVGSLGAATIVNNSPGNVALKIVVLMIFGAAYALGKKIVKIKI